MPRRLSAPFCFSVATLNLRFGLADDGENGWEHRKAAVDALFSEFRPDFIAFQEVNDFQFNHLAALLSGHAAIGRRKDPPDRWQDNVVFYRKNWRLVRDEHFYLSPTPDTPSRFPDSKWPRQGALGVFAKDGFTLAVANTHFDFDARVQEKSARLLLSRLAGQSNGLPAVLTGDFNTTPGSGCYRLLTHPLSGGFQNVFSPPFPGTHHGFTGEPKDPIDWVLFRGDLVVTDAQVIRKQYHGKYPSDHFPVFAAFERVGG